MNAVRTALLLASFLALGACSEGSAKRKSEPPPVPVTAAQAVARDIPIRLQVVGRAEAYESVALKSRVDGQVAALLFSEGQHVKQGDLLIRLDSADLAARLAQAQAGAARDEALLAKMRADTTRYMALKERNFVSEEKVNDTRTNEAAALANLRASKAAVEVARLQRDYAEIRAPIAGVIGARLVFPGSTIKTNDTTLAVINRVQPLLVSFPVPEKHLLRLREALLEAQFELQQQGRFPVIILINGVEGAGKGETVKLLNEWMDPRLIQVSTFDVQTDEELARPPAWRFWRPVQRSTTALHPRSAARPSG